MNDSSAVTAASVMGLLFGMVLGAILGALIAIAIFNQVACKDVSGLVQFLGAHQGNYSVCQTPWQAPQLNQQ